MKTPISKSQIRALKVSGLPEASGYAEAARLLEQAGLRGDGIPANQSWRSAAKLSDAALLHLLGVRYERPLEGAEIAEGRY